MGAHWGKSTVYNREFGVWGGATVRACVLGKEALATIGLTVRWKIAARKAVRDKSMAGDEVAKWLKIQKIKKVWNPMILESTGSALHLQVQNTEDKTKKKRGKKNILSILFNF